MADLLGIDLPRRIHHQLADDDAVKLFQIVVLILKERKLVALIILRHSQAKPGDRIQMPRRQYQRP